MAKFETMSNDPKGHLRRTHECTSPEEKVSNVNTERAEGRDAGHLQGSANQ